MFLPGVPVKYTLNTCSKAKGYLGLHNKADREVDFQRVAEQSIRYAEQYFNDGTPLKDYYVEVRDSHGGLVKTIRL